MPRKNNKLWHKIKKLKSQEDQNSLRWHVLDYVQTNYHEDSEIEFFFKKFLSLGCVSGWIDHLVFYSQTHKFYDKYYEDIEDLRYEMEDSLGEPLRIKGDLKNWLAWFGFQETAYQIACDLEI